MTSPARVAARHIARAYSSGDVAAMADKFREAIRLFEKILFVMTWRKLINAGRDVATWVVETRAIPPAKVKAVEMAARLFLTAARDPKDHAVWWEKNEKHARLLLEALSWPEKMEGGDGVQEKVTVGPFVMHNTLHLADEKLASTISVVEKATLRIRSSNGKLAKVLYGDVFVVGKISQSRDLAWYYINDDSLYLRLMSGLTEVRSLCHELGHRYWYKFLQGDAQRQWRTTYYVMKNTNVPKVELPKVGEPLGVSVKGHTEMPIVESYGFVRGTRVINLVGGGAVSVSGIFGFLEEKAVATKFPTPYAATKAEEYFAECFADYVGGTLAPEHVKLFEEAVGI